MIWDGLRLSVTLLSVIPLRGARASRRAAAWAMAWAPAVGLGLGITAGAVLTAVDRVLRGAPLLAAALALAVLALLTRGLHLDGLADLTDGLGGGKTAPEALDIMRRSDIGPFGAAALVLTLLVQAAALAQAQSRGNGFPAIVSAVVAGRLAITWACRRGVPAARAEGLGALVAGTLPVSVPGVITAASLGLAALGGWLVAGVTGAWALPVAVAAGLAASFVLTWHVSRRLGGITGDVLGGLCEVATAACLVVTAGVAA
ncbi:MAG: adenosylcobinamide-GDP ribazoletransferase [Micromonosporaceae bacterium]